MKQRNRQLDDDMVLSFDVVISTSSGGVSEVWTSRARENLGSPCYWILAAILLVFWVMLWPTGALAFSDQEAKQALDAAMQYADLEYVIQGELWQGMAYFYGGQDTISSYLGKIEQGVQPGAGAGIDASGLVINAYKAIYPDLRFLYRTNSQETKVSDTSSKSLYLWNVRTVELEDLQPGDLIFFGQEGNIHGVALYAGRRGESIRIVTASQSQGKVVLTGIRAGGDYWRSSFAGAGRLIKR